LLPAAFALTASLVWGLGDFLGGLKSRAIPVLAVMAASQPFGLAVLALAVAIRGTGPGGPEVAWAALAALFGTAGLVAFYRGMAAGAMSVVAPIAAVAAGVPVAWGVLSGDKLGGLQGIGVAAALGGSVMTSLERRGDQTRVAAGVGWAVLAMLGFGGYFVPMHAAAAHDWLWPAFVFRGTSVAVVWAVLGARRDRLRGVRPHLPVLVAVGLLDTGGIAVFSAASSTHGLLSIVAVLASLYPVVTVLLARFFLGERVQLAQSVGVVVTLAGVGLITAGG
jgi:drug/metabolite transporter (DMT)-like permease